MTQFLSYVSNGWEKNKRDFGNFSSLFETSAFQILLTKTLEMFEDWIPK